MAIIWSQQIAKVVTKVVVFPVIASGVAMDFESSDTPAVPEAILLEDVPNATLAGNRIVHGSDHGVFDLDSALNLFVAILLAVHVVVFGGMLLLLKPWRVCGFDSGSSFRRSQSQSRSRGPSRLGESRSGYGFDHSSALSTRSRR